MGTTFITSEEGEPNVEAIVDPMPGNNSIAKVNSKLDAILAALGITYEEDDSDDNQ